MISLSNKKQSINLDQQPQIQVPMKDKKPSQNDKNYKGICKFHAKQITHFDLNSLSKKKQQIKSNRLLLCNRCIQELNIRKIYHGQFAKKVVQKRQFRQVYIEKPLEKYTCQKTQRQRITNNKLLNYTKQQFENQMFNFNKNIKQLNQKFRSSISDIFENLKHPYDGQQIKKFEEDKFSQGMIEEFYKSYYMLQKYDVLIGKNSEQVCENSVQIFKSVLAQILDIDNIITIFFRKLNLQVQNQIMFASKLFLFQKIQYSLFQILAIVNIDYLIFLFIKLQQVYDNFQAQMYNTQKAFKEHLKIFEKQKMKRQRQQNIQSKSEVNEKKKKQEMKPEQPQRMIKKNSQSSARMIPERQTGQQKIKIKKSEKSRASPKIYSRPNRMRQGSSDQSSSDDSSNSRSSSSGSDSQHEKKERKHQNRKHNNGNSHHDKNKTKFIVKNDGQKPSRRQNVHMLSQQYQFSKQRYVVKFIIHKLNSQRLGAQEIHWLDSKQFKLRYPIAYRQYRENKTLIRRCQKINRNI